MTWRDLWRRIVLLWRAERNWRKGIRLPACQDCGEILLEATGHGPWRCDYCVESLHTEQRRKADEFYSMTLGEHRQIMAAQTLAMQNVPIPDALARQMLNAASQQQATALYAQACQQANPYSSALGSTLGGLGRSAFGGLLGYKRS